MPPKPKTIKLNKDPHDILQDPLLNKGTAFTQKERDALGLNGLLPYWVSTVEEQIERNYNGFNKKRTTLGKYVFLTGLLNRNEILFYQLADRYIYEVLPIIYTPTVGEASLQYSMIYKQRRGIYLSYPLRDKMDEIIQNIPNEEIDVIVATDGERILGLGDQGIGGMAIPIGKAALYTLFGGIHPSKTLPVLLDIGTNNPDLLNHKLYLGWRHERISGDEYLEFIDRFVKAIKKHFPNVLLQWEDFGKEHAKQLLDRYRDKILSFNDDIQGTASVVLGALYAASKRAKVEFKEHRIALLGGGSAGLGIAEILCQALILEGLSKEEALARIYVIDIEGLLHKGLPNLNEEQKHFEKNPKDFKDWHMANVEKVSLLDVIRNVHPTVLIGVSAQTGAFNEEMIRLMGSYCERPIIFPLSNPTSKSEALPNELLTWTDGRAIVATGSPFQAVTFKDKLYQIAQCNNALIFPGVGLGAIVSKATKISDEMFLQAAKVISKLSPENEFASLFPPLTQLRDVSKHVALAVAQQAMKEGIAPKIGMDELEKKINDFMWHPHYDYYEK